jgi:glycosyltransferase involved in cell wall biosynthesis
LYFRHCAGDLVSLFFLRLPTVQSQKITAPVMDLLGSVTQNLLTITPQGAGRILAVGCGDGKILAQRRLIRPDVRIYGQEEDRTKAAFAETVLDKVTGESADLLVPLEFMGDIPPDLITIAAGLNEAEDPGELLKRLADALCTGGTLALCVAASDEARHIWALIDNAAPSLKNSGKRPAFDIDKISDWMRMAGLADCGKYSCRFINAQSTTAESPPTGQPGFWLLRFVKAPLRKLYVQTLTIPPRGGINEVRIHQPNAFLSAEPGVITKVEGTDTTFDHVPNVPRLFIFHRRNLSIAEHLVAARMMRNMGFLFLVEFDDHPCVWPSISENDNILFRGVHAVQTSTQDLATLFRQWNPEVGVFPNAVAELLPPRAPRNPDDPITLFFGAFNRKEDWQPILPSLNKILKERKSILRVEVIHDNEFFDLLETTNKTFTPTCDYAQYLEILNRSDIALLPLNPGTFNEMKSNLKFLECAATGAVALASPTVYGTCIQPNETGLIFEDREDFAIKLASLIKNDALRNRLATQARAWLLESHLLWQQTAKRRAWYEDLWARQKQIDNALLERVPDIAESET